MSTSDGIRRKDFFIAADAIVNIPTTKTAQEQEDKEQQPQREKNEDREQQNLPEATPEINQDTETLPKGKRWSKTMLLWDSQPRRRVMLRQRWETEANWRVIIRLPVIRLSNNQTQWYMGKRWRRPTRQLLAAKRRKLLLSFLQHPSKTKDLIQGNFYSHGIRKKGSIPKRKRAWYQKDKGLGKIQIQSQKEVVDMGRLFAHKYFPLYSNFNDIVNYTLSS